VERVGCYLVCATPRSGSTLLCELLKDTGVAGRPEEYFEARSDTGLPSHPGDYLDDLPRTGAGIRDDATPPRAPEHSSLAGLSNYRDHLERTFRLGTTDNGVFGAKIMWRHLGEFEQLAWTLPEYAGLERHELLERIFDGPRYVWVARADKVRQAVSLWRALQTRSWRLEHGAEDTRTVELHYRFEGIEHLVRALQAEDRTWGEFFDRHAIPVLRVGYEAELVPDRERTVRSVLHHVGVDPPANWHPAEVMQQQADELSDEWVDAYHRDAVQRDLRARSAAR